MKNKYRIKTDGFGCFMPQIRYWWLPFIWINLVLYGYPLKQRAEELIAKHRKPSKVYYVD